jgi:para-aminobenzoate synthetase component 1
MKGTIKRSTDPATDIRLKDELAKSEKDKNENVMIVDLVRNDLSRIALRGSVKVEELFGVHTFEHVHQMISTVSCNVKEDITLNEILAATFPMGSMTGAPKIRAMQLIEEFETTKRGLYSGAAGFVHENGDFDLAVVIRSVIYNPETGYLSFMVGSAITAQCNPEKEYDECLLKARPIIEVLQGYGVLPV